MAAIRSRAGSSKARPAFAGAVAAAAYVAAMEVDLRLVNRNTDDLILLGRPLAPRREWAKPIGAVVHLANGAAFGMLYAAVQHRLPGPPWVRGVVFFNVENAVLYPLTLLERFHPAIKDGQIAPYANKVAFLQSVPRHVVFGVVLGVLEARFNRPKGSSR